MVDRHYQSTGTGCVTNCVLLIVNILCFVVGVGVVTLASYFLHKAIRYHYLTDENFVLSVPLWFLIFSVSMTMIAFFGCCGIFRKSTCMLNAYGCLVLVLVTAELVCGALLIGYYTQVKQHMAMSMERRFNDYYRGDRDLQDSINWAQHSLECCGVHSYHDWFYFRYNLGRSVTVGCCRPNPGVSSDLCYVNVGLLPETVRAKRVWTVGCYEKLERFVTRYGFPICVLVAIYLAMQILLMIMAFCSAANFKRIKYGFIQPYHMR